jgi:hypothetical protein
MRLPHGGGFRSLIAGCLSGDRTAAVGRPNPRYSWLRHSRAARLLDFGAGCPGRTELVSQRLALRDHFVARDRRGRVAEDPLLKIDQDPGGRLGSTLPLRDACAWEGTTMF